MSESIDKLHEVMFDYFTKTVKTLEQVCSEACTTESREDWLRRRNLKCMGVQHKAIAKESQELLKQAQKKPRNPFDQPFNNDPRLGSRG